MGVSIEHGRRKDRVYQILKSVFGVLPCLNRVGCRIGIRKINKYIGSSSSSHPLNEMLQYKQVARSSANSCGV